MEKDNNCFNDLCVLIQPPITDNHWSKLIYPSIPYLMKSLQTEGIEPIVLNINKEYLIYEKNVFIQSCIKLANHDEYFKIDCFNTPEEMRYIYWSQYLCKLINLYRSKITVSNDGDFLIDNKYSFNRFINHLWIPYLENLKMDVPLINLELWINRYNIIKKRFVDFLNSYFINYYFGNNILVGITIPYVDQISYSLIISKVLKDRYKNITIVLGGTAFSIIKNSNIKDLLKLPFIDGVIRGEGERAIVDLYKMKTKDKKKIYTTYPYSKDTLMTLPPINYGEVCKEIINNTEATLVQSRGCFWSKCVYCNYKNLHGKNNYAVRPIKLLMQEISNCIANNLNNIYLDCECITEKYAREFANEIIKSNININWRCFLRPDPMRISTLEIIKESGGKNFIIGLETVNQRLLELYRKGTTKKNIINFFDNLSKVDLKVFVNIIPDLPTVTVAELNETLEFLKSYKNIIQMIDLSYFKLISNTEIILDPAKYGIKIINSSPKMFSQINVLKFIRQEGSSFSKLKSTFKKLHDFSEELEIKHNKTHNTRKRINDEEYMFSLPAPDFIDKNSTNKKLNKIVYYNIKNERFKISSR